MLKSTYLLISQSTISAFTLMILLCSCDMIQRAKTEIRVIKENKNVAIRMAKENREMESKIRALYFNIQELESKNNYLQIKLKKGCNQEKISRLEKRTGRKVASLVAEKTSVPTDKKRMYIKMGAYKWTPNQALAIGANALKTKDYAKAFQYFHAFISQLPNHKKVDDNLLFRTGMAAFESQRYKDGIAYFDQLIQKFPKSKNYRNAKLWKGISALKLGRKKQFIATVNEFRKKYRNTNEWNILSQHYEKIIYHYDTY